MVLENTIYALILINLSDIIFFNMRKYKYFQYIWSNYYLSATFKN